MLLSPYFFGLTSLFMSNTLILHVSCVYFLSSFSLLCVSSYGLGTYKGHPTEQRSHIDCNQVPWHSRKMPASSDSTHDCLLLFLLGGLMPQQAGTHVQTSNCWRVPLELAFGEIYLTTFALQNLKKKLLQNHNL